MAGLSDYTSETLNTEALNNVVKDYSGLDALTSIDTKSYASIQDSLGFASPATRRFLDTTRTFDQKLANVQEKRLNKMLDINDYSTFKVLGFDDPDTLLVDVNGDTKKLRVHSGSGLMYDAVDKPDLVFGRTEDYKKSEASRSRQIAQVAEIYNKPVWEVTDDDVQQVKNWQSSDFLRRLIDPDFKFQKFDPNQRYEDATGALQGIELKGKLLGKDEHDRLLVDVVNPHTGRSLGFDLATNPYTNARFNEQKSIDTERNRQALDNFEVLNRSALDLSLEATKQPSNQSKIGDFFDLAQSTAYQSAARVLQYLPGDTGKYWAKVADSETGQKWADLATGVDQRTREDFSNDGKKIVEYVQKGEYAKAVGTTLLNLDRFLAESLPQMAMLIGGRGAASKIVSRLGMTGKAGALSELGLGAIPVALDKTLQDAEDFKKNNGRSMNAAEYARTFAGALLTTVPDELLLGMFGGTAKNIFTNLIKRGVQSGTESIAKTGKQAFSDVVKSFVTGAAGEAGQEMLESGWDTASSAKQEGRNFWTDILPESMTSDENIAAGIIGGTMGGALGGGIQGLNVAVDARANARRLKIANKTAEINRTKTQSGADADIESSEKFISSLNPTSIKDKYTELTNANITPEDAHKYAEDLRTQLKNPNSAFSRDAYNAGIQEAVKWDIAAAHYYKDKGYTNEQIEKELGKSLKDLFGEVVYGSNLNSKRLYDEEAQKPKEGEYEQEEERLTTLGKDLGLDEKYVKETIESVNNNVRYGGSGYYTYRDRIKENLQRLHTESLTPESKERYESSITDDLSGMLRLYSDQYYKTNTIMEAAEKLAATNERHAETSWMLRNSPFVVNRTNVANGSYADEKGVYAIFKNAAKDVKDIETEINSLVKSGIPQELIDKAMEVVSNETTSPRPMAPFNMIDSIKQRFDNAALSLRTQARDQSKFSGKNFSVDDLTSSLTYLTKSTDKTKDSAKYNQAFQNLHYAFTQKPEMVDALKTKVNGWKNEALKQKALGEIDRIATYRDEIGTESEARKAQHDPYVKSMKAALDEIDKLYVQDTYDESGETNESRMQKLRKQAGYLDRLQKLRANFQAVIDTNSKEDIALRDHLDKTIGEVQKKVALFSSNRSGQETGKGKFKDNVKNFISSIKRLANKKVLETQLKSLQKKYDDGILKGHSDELLEEIQAKITAVQDRLNELNNQEESKPNPKPNQTAESTSETTTEEEPEEEEDFLVQEIKKSTDISWLESTRDNLTVSNPNDHRVSHYTELINKRIEEVKASDTKKPTRTAFNTSYNYGEYNSLRNDPVFVALVSAIINDSSIAPNVTFKRISYFLSDEFEAKLKDKNLSEKELKKFQKELVRLTEAITEIKNSLYNKNNKKHIDKLLDKVVQKILPKLQKDYNKQVREAYKEAKSELGQSTIWKLVKGEYGKISYDSLVKVTDKQTANALRKKLPKLIVKEDGLSLDLIASNTDNDLGQAEKVFEGDPSKVAEMLYQTIIADEKTLNGEARKQAQDSAKAEEAKLEAFKENPKSILYGHLNRLLQAIDMRLQSMDQVISGDARILREDGSESTGRGGDGNSSTTPSGSDSTASQAPNSGNAPNTPSGASQSSPNGQGVQTPTPTPQGSQNGSQRPSQGSQVMSPEEFTKAYPEEIHTGILKALQELYAEQRTAIGDANFASYIDRFIDRKYRDIITDNFEQNIVPFVESQSYFKYNQALTDEVKHESMYDVNLDAIKNINNLDKAPWIANNSNRNESNSTNGITYNKWMKEAIEAHIQDDKQNAHINGTQSLLTTKEITERDGKKKTISTRVVGWMGYHQNNKGASEIPFELTRQIKEVNGEAESYLAYNYHLLADQIDPLTGKTYIESIREYAERIKFDPKQINKPNPLLYFRSQALAEKDKENDKTNEESELVFNNSILAKFPAFRLLYDIDGVFRSSKGEPLVKNYNIKFNDFTLTLVDFSLREYLTNSDYDGYFKVNQLTDEQIANMFGEDIDTLTPSDLQDLRSTISNYGIPRSVMINALGALILRNMGIVENKKSSNYGFFSSLTASIGAWAVDYGEQRGLYKLTEFNPPEGHYLSKGKNKAKTIHLLQIDNTHKERIAKLQESFQGTVESTDNLGKRTRKPNGLNQFKNSKANLSNDPVWDNREISYTNEDTPVYVKNSGNLSEVSMFRRKVMEKMANVKYRFDTDITDFLNEKIDGVTGWDLLARTMGYTDKNELQFLSADEQESVKGRNLDIEKQINALKDGIEKQRELLKDPNSGWSKDNWDAGIRFKQFWSKNGRIFIDSSSMNPQTMKLLRFTCLAEGMHYDFDPNDKTQIKVENYAIAQAFDKLASAEKTDKFAEAMKSLSVDNLKLVRKLLISNSAKKFEKAIKKLAETNEAFKVLVETGISVESIPQCLNALTHLIRRQEANGKKFNTSLVVENDSTTSGYVIKMLQMPLTSIKNLEKLLEKVGVTFENNANGLLTIHELKKTEGFNDLYRTTASEVSDYIDKLLSDKGKIMRDKVFSKDIYPGDRSGNSYPNHPAVKFLNETFLDFKEALPKKTLQGTISGAFRTLMKPATMVFGYSAGIKSISNKLAGTVLQDYVNVYTVLNLKYKGDITKYVKESGVDYTEQEVAAIQRGMQAIAEKYTPTKKGMPASFLEAIQKYSYHEIQLALSDNAKQPYQISLENCFQRLIGNTYGKAAGEALEKIFKPYVDINNRMIEMTNTAAHMYKQIYEYKFNQLIENARKSNKTVSNKDVGKLRKDLKNLQPYLNLADDNTTLVTVGNSQLLEYANTSQMALTKFDKDRSTFNLGASYYLKNGNAVSNSYAFGYERTPAYPERAGAVIPIHCLDGAIMADIMDRYAQEGMLGIHDAIVMSAFKSEDISKYYNQRLALRCKEYNVFNDIYNNFTRVTNEFEKICNKDPELKDMFLKYGTKNYELTGGNGLPIVRKPIYANGIHVDDEYKTISDLLEGYTVTRRKNLGGGKYAYVDVYTKGVIETDEDISRSRAYLDSLTYRVANLDTATNAGVYVYSDSSTLVEQGLRGSSPNSYQTNGAINNIYHKALDDPEERANIVDYVQNLAASLGNKLCSDKHVARLKKLVRSIAPERIRGTVLDIADNGRWTAGQYDPGKKHIQLVMDDKSASRLLDSKTKLCVLSLLAPAETYAHEVLHAGNEFAFTHRGVFGFNSQIRKLLAIQEEAKKVITWKDFMPADGTFDESLRPYYERHARAFHNYIFVEQDPKTLASLNEFCSFVATNENLRAKLANITINQPTMNPNANLVDRLIAILKGMYDVIFSKKKFSEVFTRTYKVLKGDSTGKTVSLLDEFDRLHRQLHTANHKAINSLFAQPMKYFETFLSVTDELIKSGNEKIHGYLHKMFNFHEIKRDEALAKAQEARLQNDDAKEKAYIEEAAKHIPQVNIATNATKWEITKELGKLAKTIVTSGEARKNMRMIMRDLTRISQQGLWMSTYRDFMGPDEGTSIFEALGMRLRMVDKISKNQEATAMKVLQDAFGKPLNDYENTALANAFLYTDAQSLYDGQNLGEVVSFLKDPNLRKQNISQILDTFKQKLSPRDYSWLQYSAVSTAYHMVHSIGNPLLNLNAKNIAEGRGWDHSLNLTDIEIAQLDKLITLYALDNTSQEFLDVTATLPAKGIEQFLKMHKEFVDESKHGYKDVSDSGQVVITPFMEATNVMKGYTKTMTDPSIESVIAVPDATDPEAMKKQGYDDKMTLTADGIVNSKDAHVYTRFGIPNRRDGNTVSVQGHNAMGKTLMQFAFSEEDQLDIKNGLSRDDETRKREAIKRWRAMRKKADDNLVKLRNDVIAASKSNKEFTFDDIGKIINQYSSFSPIYNDKVSGPADYRQTLARDIKRQHLGLDERGLTILSRMFGSVTRQIYGAGANKVLLEFTKDYMKKNMNFMTNMDMQGHKFIKIEKDSPNKYLRESWKVIPENFKEYAKNNNLYIREDWLQDYFGVSNYTLLDNDKVKRHTGYLIKRGIAIAEMIMKTIAYARKQAIVLKIPGVLVGNIVSNLMFSIMNHRNPIKVIKTTIANAQAIRDYIENRKALDRILFKTRLGTVTAEETSQIPALRRKIENNIVKPLMEKGMYQSIIEDMQSDELESIGRVNKWLKHNKIAQKLPSSVKNTFKTVFMMEGTPAYDFMFIATQYSDFVARCTEYQLSMDEVPAEYERAKKKGTTKETLSQFMQRREKEISTMITNAFINYDKPQSKFEQYMNDLGLIMFSKFGKRIQSVIKNQLYHRPIHALLFLMSQVTFIDTEDILEQNLFNKNWLNLMHSPIDNFIGAAIPMPIQIMFGDQKAF